MKVMKVEESLGRCQMDPCWAGRVEDCWTELAGGPCPLVDLAGMADGERHSDLSAEWVAEVVVADEVELTQPSYL